MKNLKFTGVNIAAAILVLAYFMSWVNASMITYSGFKLTTTAISPGMLAYVISGVSRLLLILIAVVPLSGAFLIWQSVSPQAQYQQYIRPAHFAPLAVLVAAIAILYFKAQSQVAQAQEAMGAYGAMMPKIPTPGLFDVMDIGLYLSIAASIYLLLVGLGRVTDKEYFNKSTEPAVAAATVDTTVQGTTTAANTGSE